VDVHADLPISIQERILAGDRSNSRERSHSPHMNSRNATQMYSETFNMAKNDQRLQGEVSAEEFINASVDDLQQLNIIDEHLRTVFKT
jgi:hypothetical protein